MKFKTSTLCTTHIDSPLGGITLAATDQGLAGAWFDHQRHWPDTRGWQTDEAHPVLRQAAAQLDDYFAGRRDSFDLPLDLSHGTAFQQSVWQALRAIPAGGTTSYGAVARKIGAPRSVRAVARAIASNPIAVAIPCHRVIASDGALTGYRWGLARKRALLDREAK